MPSLDFKGKSFIYTHHLGVPYRELLVVPEKSCPAANRKPDLDDNLIIHGDNLEALKALLPRYAGKVDCIYIDPPYNTGTEGWCYNDAVNAPLMREWLKKSANPVERDDLQRHDKWLCMMWPRLMLLKELLAEDGAIFISIDDNEVHRLRAVLDEIFGEDRFIANIVWQKAYSPRMDAQGFSRDHDHVLIFGKSPESAVGKISVGEGDTGPLTIRFRSWRKEGSGSLRSDRQNLWYPIKDPDGGQVFPIKPDGTEGRWRGELAYFQKLDKDGKVEWTKRENGWQVYIRQEVDTAKPRPPSTWWDCGFAGHNHEAAETLKEIMGVGVFQTPKPLSLLARILEVSTDEDSIILDTFAGSGTTGHAVLALNAKDNGSRRFILCEMEEYADKLTAERVRRVIQGYDYQGTTETVLHPQVKVTWTTFKKAHEWLDRIEGIENLESANYEKIEKKIEDGVLTIVGKKTVKKKMPGLGGSFTYVELGEAMDLERLLAEKPGTLPSFGALARYLFFTATGHTLPSAPKSAAAAKRPAKQGLSPDLPSDPVLIGETAVWRIYLHYRPDEAWLRSPAAAFTRTQAETIAAAREKEASGKQVLVFAAAKYISHRSLRELHVDFAQLPYALHRVQSE